MTRCLRPRLYWEQEQLPNKHFVWTVTKSGLSWVTCNTNNLFFLLQNVFLLLLHILPATWSGFEINGAAALFISMGMSKKLKLVCRVLSTQNHWKIIPRDEVSPLCFQTKLLLYIFMQLLKHKFSLSRSKGSSWTQRAVALHLHLLVICKWISNSYRGSQLQSPHRYLPPFLSANTTLSKSTADALSVEIGLVKGTDSSENFCVDRAL